MSVKFYKIKITICYKTNLKFFQYNAGRPTCTVATFKKYRLALSKPDMYFESALFVPLKSAKNFKKKVTVCYKTNLKFIQYNVIGLCFKFATISIFGYYMTIHFRIIWDTKEKKINIIKYSRGIAYP